VVVDEGVVRLVWKERVGSAIVENDMFQKFFIFLLLVAAAGECKLPQLTPRDVKNKVEEILKAHVSHKSLSLELIERSLANFCEELDPTKTYFLEEEIAPWIHPTPVMLQRGREGVLKADFSLFQEIHAQFVRAIERRGQIETANALKELPKGVKNEEFKEMSWASSEAELSDRILRIKSLQVQAADKVGEGRERFLQYLQKRRLNREAELGQAQESLKISLTYALKAIAGACDAHTHYFIPNEANQFLIQVQQRLFGIGAQLRDDLDGLAVTQIIENSPASHKLRLNDKIIAVNQEPVMGLDISEAVELIRGEKGTPVLVTILRKVTEEGGEERVEKLDLEIIRGEIVVEESRLETHVEPYGDGVIATLRLYSFYQDPKNSAALDIRKALEQLKEKEKLKGVLLDLRGNAGGLLNQAVAVTGLFMKKGVVVSVKDHTGMIQRLRETEGKPVWEGPLFVLINRASASSAEIVAQTLQDYGRALVLGDDHSFGKGSFQTFTLDAVGNPKINPLGEYTVTRGKYYTVSGKTPQLQGVVSDIVVPGVLSEVEIGEKYAKFPLENDEIAPSFDDDLSDLSPFHRLQLGQSYKLQLQEPLATYTPWLELLRKNSDCRLKNNKNYQNFLQELHKKNYDSDQVDLFSSVDLQWLQALNIMKDYLFLSSKPNGTP